MKNKFLISLSALIYGLFLLLPHNVSAAPVYYYDNTNLATSTTRVGSYWASGGSFDTKNYGATVYKANFTNPINAVSTSWGVGNNFGCSNTLKVYSMTSTSTNLGTLLGTANTSRTCAQYLGNTGQVQDWTFDTPINITAGNYYAFVAYWTVDGSATFQRMSHSAGITVDNPDLGIERFTTGLAFQNWDNGDPLFRIGYDYSGGDPSTQTHISWQSPVKGASTASRGINFIFTYYLNSSTDTASENNKILLQLCPQGYPQDPCQKITVTSTTTPDTIQTATITATTTRDGYYIGLVNFWNGVEKSTTCSWYDIGCTSATAKVGKGSSNSFNVATTSLAVDIPFSQASLQSLCDDGSFTSGVCKAMVYLLYPSQEAVDGFTGLQDQLRGKIPFSFFYTIYDRINLITASTTALAGTDVVVNMDNTFINGDVTIFSWSGAKTSFDKMVTTNSVNYIIYVEWIIFSIYAIYRIISII